MGSTGKMWGHQYWYLNDCPDIVTFASKNGLSGYYSTMDFKLNQQGVSFEKTLDIKRL